MTDIVLEPKIFFLVIPLTIWSLAWKGVALWKAAQKGHKKWFIAILILNTLGILEMVYIFIFSKKIPSITQK
jgi:hypothetical protein